MCRKGIKPPGLLYFPVICVPHTRPKGVFSLDYYGTLVTPWWEKGSWKSQLFPQTISPLLRSPRKIGILVFCAQTIPTRVGQYRDGSTVPIFSIVKQVFKLSPETIWNCKMIVIYHFWSKHTLWDPNPGLGHGQMAYIQPIWMIHFSV